MQWLHVSSCEWFNRRQRCQARGNAREQRTPRSQPRAATWAQIVEVREHAKGESWAGFANRRGDWGQDAALRLGRRAGRLRLIELGQLASGLDYAVASKALARFGSRMARDVALSKQLAALEKQLSK